MKRQTVLKGNKLIAEFMGAEILSPKTQFTYYDFGEKWYDLNGYIFQQKIHDNSLRYHLSWDWLMPVVEKIATIPTNYPDGIYKYMVNVELNPITGVEIKDMYKINFNSEKGFEILIHENDFITNVWLAVVEFIKWYNLNKNN